MNLEIYWVWQLHANLYEVELVGFKEVLVDFGDTLVHADEEQKKEEVDGNVD